jgi:SAM-dependent methyltransferase
VGLARHGHRVAATDASEAMVARTRRLAAAQGVALDARVCAWEDLAGQDWDGAFDAVLCVGNSLAHAHGQTGRRAALAAMAAVLQPGGLLVVTCRRWEDERAGGSRLEVADRLVERDGRAGLVVRAWTIPERWEDEHHLDVAVAFPRPDGTVVTHAERLSFWPFTHATLQDDLRAAGLRPASSTFGDGAPRYVVNARPA